MNSKSFLQIKTTVIVANVEIRFEEQVAKPPTGLISESFKPRGKVLRKNLHKERFREKKHFLFVGATDCTTHTNVNMTASQ